MGPNFQKHILFQFQVHDKVHVKVHDKVNDKVRDKVHDTVLDTFLDQAPWLILGFLILANISKR